MKVAAIGAGAWGTALSKILCESGHSVVLWCREPDVHASIGERHVNQRFLPGVALPPSLRTTLEIEDAVRAAEVVVLSVPSPFLRAVLKTLASHVHAEQRFVSATKGLEESTLMRMSEVLGDVLPFRPDVVAISGPTFAREAAMSEPTALVAASVSEESARFVQSRFSTPNFRVYTNDDLVGVELGGALKNVIALAAGVASGLGLGHNPLAAIMTRGLAEISRLAEALGGRRETLAGLSGMGDLVLTCTGHLSRNRRVGIQLGEGKTIEAVLSGMEQVAEGVRTTRAAIRLAATHGVEMPIAFQMDRLLRGETTARAVVDELMSRPLKAEV